MVVQDFLKGLVRLELSDSSISRWPQDQLLTFLRQAVVRANHLAREQRLPFAMAKQEGTVAAGETGFPVPSDFLAPISLVVPGRTPPEVKQIGFEEYDCLISAEEMRFWLLDGSRVEFLTAPTSETAYRFRYFTDALPDSLTLSSQMPWEDKLNPILAEYVALRAKNVDEMEVSVDMGLLDDLENRITATFKAHAPTTIRSKGWR